MAKLEFLFATYDKEHTIIEFHVVSVDPNASGGRYRQIGSLTGFRHRMMAHTQSWKDDIFLGYRNLNKVRYSELVFPKSTYDYAYESFIAYERELTNYDPDIEKIPVIRHSSVWDFYKHIDYDHKRRKLAGITLQRNR